MQQKVVTRSVSLRCQVNEAATLSPSACECDLGPDWGAAAVAELRQRCVSNDNMKNPGSLQSCLFIIAGMHGPLNCIQMMSASRFAHLDDVSI